MCLTMLLPPPPPSFPTPQELGFYRRVDHVLQAVQAGAVYAPLSQPTVDALTQGGHNPMQWQPLQYQAAPPAAAAGDADSAAAAGADGNNQQELHASSSTATAREAAQAADAQLRLALQRLCGFSSSLIATAEDSSPRASASPALGLPTDSSASPASSQAFGTGQQPPAAAAMQSAAMQPAVVCVDGGAAAAASRGVDAADAANSSSSNKGGDGSEPVWLYINHLGWCR
jgi:hypothetical protein